MRTATERPIAHSLRELPVHVGATMIAFRGNRAISVPDLNEGHVMQADLLTLEALITGTTMVSLVFGRMAISARKAALLKARMRELV